MVEGKDDAAMLYKLLEHMGVSSDSFQIFEYKSKEKFPIALRNISALKEFEMVTKLAIFRDADESSESAFQSIQYHINACDFIPPSATPSNQGVIAKDDQNTIAVGVYITPNCVDQGALESLLLSSLTGEMKQEIDGFVTRAETCLSTERSREKFRNSDKSKTYAYSALFENANFHDIFSKRLWDYDHPVFDKLKAFIRDFY